MIVGYARTSTIEQEAGMAAQMRELQASGCTKIFEEQVSSAAERDRLKEALSFVREGDVFVVYKLDRLARSVPNLLEIFKILEGKGVVLRIIGLGIDTSTPTGRMLLTMLGAVAQFEREVMLERQREGIAKARASGKFRGRAPLDKRVIESIIELGETRLTRHQVAKRLGLCVSTVYKVLKNHARAVAQEAQLIAGPVD